MSVFNEIFGSGFDLYKFLSQKLKDKDSTKQLIYRELKNNIQRLEHRNKKGVDTIMLIKKLENVSIYNAIKDGFDFKQLAPKIVVDDNIIAFFSHSSRFKGWNSEQIILSIDEKLTALKDIIELYSNINDAPINLTKRLNKLFVLCILLVILMKESAHK
jgi:hypothetical protein